MKYFSDVEQGEKERISEEITIDIHKGIVATYKKHAMKNSFSEAAPMNCPDELPGICGFLEKQFFELAKGNIKNFQLDNYDDKYMILDFVQFCFSHIKKANKSISIPYIHGLDGKDSYAPSYELVESEDEKNSFREDINTIFRRNGLVFELQEDGTIIRKIPKGLVPIVSPLYTTKDADLNKLVNDAFDSFLKDRIEDRKIGLVTIWGAFEQMKNYYTNSDTDVKKSITRLIQEVTANNEAFSKILNDEALALGKIGNEFQIRHKNPKQHEIATEEQIDNFFYRMASFMQIFLKHLEKDK